MNQTEFSVDGGQTWLPLGEPLRVVFREAAEDDGTLQDLYMTVTPEGVTYDLVNRSDGEVVVSQTDYVTWLAADIAEGGVEEEVL